MSKQQSELRNKIRNMYLDYAHDLIISGGSLEVHVDEAMDLFEAQLAERERKDMKNLRDWIERLHVTTSSTGYDRWTECAREIVQHIDQELSAIPQEGKLYVCDNPVCSSLHTKEELEQFSTMLSREEILERAIRKAIDGGFEFDIHSITWPSPDISASQTVYTTKGASNSSVEISIFDRRFAACIWTGTSCAQCGSTNVKVCPGCDAPLIPESDFHLQQMVIADDPIKYLGDNILTREDKE